MKELSNPVNMDITHTGISIHRSCDNAAFDRASSCQASSRGGGGRVPASSEEFPTGAAFPSGCGGLGNVAKKPFDNRTQRGVESGLLKMKIEGGVLYSNVLVSKNSRHSENFYLQPMCEYLLEK